MTTVGNIIWATIAAAGAIWFLLAFTAVGFPLVVIIVLCAAGWAVWQAVAGAREISQSDELNERATP